MIQIVNKKFPYYWQLPVYVLWGPISVVLIIIAVLPESPWYHARRGNREAAIKSLKRLYGGVIGYNCDEEYVIIERTLAHEKRMESQMEVVSWRNILSGFNRVSSLFIPIKYFR